MTSYKLDIPICSKQIFVLGKENHDLSKFTGLVERINSKDEKIKMMNFVFYGASCKNDRIILSGAGGCNSCGETFKTFNLSGEEINEKSTTLDLEPMQDIIPSFINLIIINFNNDLVKQIYCQALWFLL